MKPINLTCEKIINKAIQCLEMQAEAGYSMRFYRLVSFVHHQVDNLRDERLKNPLLLTALAYIAWNSTDKGRMEL